MILAFYDGFDLPLVQGRGEGGTIGSLGRFFNLRGDPILAMTRTAGWGSREIVSSCVLVESSHASQIQHAQVIAAINRMQHARPRSSSPHVDRI